MSKLGQVWLSRLTLGERPDASEAPQLAVDIRAAPQLVGLVPATDSPGLSHSSRGCVPPVPQALKHRRDQTGDPFDRIVACPDPLIHRPGLQHELLEPRFNGVHVDQTVEDAADLKVEKHAAPDPISRVSLMNGMFFLCCTNSASRTIEDCTCQSPLPFCLGQRTRRGPHPQSRLAHSMLRRPRRTALFRHVRNRPRAPQLRLRRQWPRLSPSGRTRIHSLWRSNDEPALHQDLRQGTVVASGRPTTKHSKRTRAGAADAGPASEFAAELQYRWRSPSGRPCAN
jgi:hypothetical protein